MQDERHYNYWEKWFQQAYQVEDFSAMNTLWLAYFVAGGSIPYKLQKFVYKKILQTVYTSLPDIIGVLFLASKFCKPGPNSFTMHRLTAECSIVGLLLNNYISNIIKLI